MSEILEAAGLRGELVKFRRHWEARQNLALRSAALGLEPGLAEVEAVTNEFRYARDLVSAEECEHWLAQFHLAFADLTSSVTRRLQARLVEADDSPEDNKPPAGDEGLFLIDAILDDVFPAWASALAWRMALAVEAGVLPATDAAISQGWEDLEGRFRDFCVDAATRVARQRSLQQQWMGLTLMKFEAAEFDSDSAAREAVFCIREDGSPLTEIAAINGLACQAAESFLDDLPSEWHRALSTALPGEVVTCQTEDSGIVVLRLLGRREPRLEDDAVSKRVDQLLIAAKMRELETRHIRWRVNLEAAS